MEILAEIRERRTARSFDGSPVDAQALERILEAGRLAPSAKNRQAWRFVAIIRPDLRSSLRDSCYGDSRLDEAGCVIAACTTNIHYTMPNGQPSYPMDLAFAVSHMMIQAEHEGLGSAILGTYDERAVKDLLTVPYAMRVALLLAVGGKVEDSTYAQRLPKDRIISYDHW